MRHDKILLEKLSMIACSALYHDILAFQARISGKQLPADTTPRRCG
ncbi:MAG: hypothetical protein IPN34_17665 [Planctomycetes bacterium]|nr:hypothetical protein [Planctomycetota bacterium]